MITCSRFASLLIALLLIGSSGLAQDEPRQSVPPSDESGAMAGRADRNTRTPAAPVETVPDLAAFRNVLDRLNNVSQTTVMDLGALQIDKWKADRNQKQQALSNSESLQKNLTAAVPELTQKALAAPGDIVPSFRLYRNLNALYDVLASLAESAGAFGAKDRYDRLAADVAEIDTIRRRLADRVDTLAATRDGEITALRARTRALTAEAAAAPVKKTVVDDTKPAKPAKKKKAKPATATPPDSAQKQ